MSALTTRARMAIAIGVVLAISVIGWLVWPSRPDPVVLNSGTPQHLVTVTVDRLRIGDTAVDVTITDRGGTPIDHAAVQVQANQPLMGHAGAPIAMIPAGDGRFHAASVALMMTGPWELRLTIDAHHGTDQLTLPLWVSG